MDEKVVARFWSRVEKSDGCWLWTGGKNSHGYGRLRLRSPRIMLTAHRISFEIHFGAPGELCVLHRCDNPPCVNPAHLFLGTKADNCRDMFAKGRGVFCRPSGESNGHAKLTVAKVLLLRKMHTEGASCAALGVHFGVSKEAAWCAATRRSWRHVP